MNKRIENLGSLGSFFPTPPRRKTEDPIALNSAQEPSYARKWEKAFPSFPGSFRPE